MGCSSQVGQGTAVVPQRPLTCRNVFDDKMSPAGRNGRPAGLEATLVTPGNHRAPRQRAGHS